MKKQKCVAIVLAAGKGSRMKADRPKQYIPLDGMPLVCHCLSAIETSSVIDRVLMVVGEGEIPYAREMVAGYEFQKVTDMIEGGKERFHSVGNALAYLAEHYPETEYVFIHDGARPYVDQALLERLYEVVCEKQACIAAVPVKDTIKVVSEDGKIIHTPERKTLWAAQTPQVFAFSLIAEAYRQMIEEDQTEGITDDAQVLERMTGHTVFIVEGDYRNRKITTPEDLS